MTEEEEDDHAVAAEYVLGLLAPAEVEAFEARLAVDPGFRALVAVWSEDLCRLLDDAVEVAPPPGAEAALMRRLFPEERRSWLTRLGLVPALLGGLVAALLVLWAAPILRPGPQGPGGLVAEVAAEDRSLVVAANFDPGTGLLAFQRTAGAVAEGRSQELWVIVGDAAPLSLGVLPEQGAVEVEVPEALRPVLAGATLAITDEPPGGSPTGGPTGAVLAAGSLTTL